MHISLTFPPFHSHDSTLFHSYTSLFHSHSCRLSRSCSAQHCFTSSHGEEQGILIQCNCKLSTFGVSMFQPTYPSPHHSHAHSSALVGALPSLPSTYLFPSLACVGVAWALLVRVLLLRSMKHHKTHYKLSEGARWQGAGGGSGPGTANGVLAGQVLGGRERLKLEVQPLVVKTGPLSRLPWGVVLRSPPVM